MNWQENELFFNFKKMCWYLLMETSQPWVNFLQTSSSFLQISTSFLHSHKFLLGQLLWLLCCLVLSLVVGAPWLRTLFRESLPAAAWIAGISLSPAILHCFYDLKTPQRVVWQHLFRNNKNSLHSTFLKEVKDFFSENSSLQLLAL